MSVCLSAVEVGLLRVQKRFHLRVLHAGMDTGRPSQVRTGVLPATKATVEQSQPLANLVPRVPPWRG